MTESLDHAENLYRDGQWDQARVICEELAKSNPALVRVWYLLGMVAVRQGRLELSAEHLSRAIDLSPDDVEMLTHASEVFRRAGRTQESIDAGRHAVLHNPHHPAPHNNLGLALQEVRQFAEAEHCFQRAVEVEPRYARGHLNLGNLLQLQHRLVEAQDRFEEALRLRPDYPQALNSLGQVLRELGRADEAVRCLRRALELRPGYPQARLNLANAFANFPADIPSDLQWQQQAEGMLSRLVAEHPNYYEAWHDLGALYEKQKRPDDAHHAYRRALAIKPDSPYALAASLNARRHVCDWSNWDADVDRLIGATRTCLSQGKPSPLWPLASCRFPTTSQDRLEIARQYAAQVAARVNGVSLIDEPGRRSALANTERLRIGFLSHEFRYQVVSHLLQGLYRRFDRQRFEILAFDYSLDDGSELRRRISQDVDRFVVLTRDTPHQQARQIADQGVHILLDINSYMPGGRPEIAAHRPAPIQVSHMYPATTGAPWIDYFLTDAVVTPPGHEEFFAEHLVYLPHSYLPTNGEQRIAKVFPSRDECGLPSVGFVYCSFNKCDKLEPRLFDVWMQILDRTPQSVLWLRDDGRAVVEHLRAAAQRRGVASERLVFAPQLPNIEEHLGRHRHADLFLDSFTHGAHATAADALFAGVPVLTCPGATFASRVAASLLRACGLPELIAATDDDYRDCAVQCALRKEVISNLKTRLAENSSTLPIFDTNGYVGNLQNAFCNMWRLYQNSQPTRSFFVR